MGKSKVVESRFDFRGGRNTAVSPDLLNENELVDATNARLVGSYGAFTKRSGCQRIHDTAFPAAIRGVFQWDTTSGKQVVVISNGDLYYRLGYDFTQAFTKAASASTARTTAAFDSPAVGSRGWNDTSGSDNGLIVVTQAVGGSSNDNGMVQKLGVTAEGDFVDAADDLYYVSFIVKADGTALGAPAGSVTSRVTIEVSVNSGGLYTAVGDPLGYSVSAGVGQVQTKTYSPVLTVTGSPAHVWFRYTLTVTSAGPSGSGTGTFQCFATVYKTDNFVATWTTGAARFSLTEPTIFAPFRADSAGAPLVLYMASGGHYFKWDSATLTQLDPTNSAPLATAIISYHTRMFAMSASPTTPGLLPKTIFWSKIGNAEDFVVGAKNQGGSAVTDFLTGQQLTALEVIGSSLLMATIDSVMRFTGQASDDIVIAQNTEGISAEVGAVGPLAIKRYENVAAMLAARGPYAVTETAAVPTGEQVLPDFDALDSANLSKSVVQYNRGRKELLYAVPGASDSGLNKTVFVQSVRLQAWYGPWNYSFGINCMCNYVNSSSIENVLSGGSDGFVRLMDVGSKDDVLYNGTGGSNITLQVEEPTFHFGDLGVTKALRQMKLQAKLPAGHDLRVKTSFDGDTLQDGSFVDTTYDGTLRDYRVDLDGQGKRCRTVFVDASAVAPTIHGFTMQAYDMQRP